MKFQALYCLEVKAHYHLEIHALYWLKVQSADLYRNESMSVWDI